MVAVYTIGFVGLAVFEVDAHMTVKVVGDETSVVSVEVEPRLATVIIL